MVMVFISQTKQTKQTKQTTIDLMLILNHKSCDGFFSKKILTLVSSFLISQMGLILFEQSGELKIQGKTIKRT